MPYFTADNINPPKRNRRKHVSDKVRNGDKIKTCDKMLNNVPLSISGGGPLDSITKRLHSSGGKEYPLGFGGSGNPGGSGSSGSSGSPGSYSPGTIFIILLVLILIAWILVALWTKFLDNFCYRTLGLDEKSSVHTFIVALVVTLILVAFIFTVGRDEMLFGDNLNKPNINNDQGYFVRWGLSNDLSDPSGSQDNTGSPASPGHQDNMRDSRDDTGDSEDTEDRTRDRSEDRIKSKTRKSKSIEKVKRHNLFNEW